ncbi:MAG: hypothetical protein DWB45_12420 [Xanthomonadales bacterium]|nr:hypothetical protein [Xanthomonadales bacterium]MDL1868685.1 hypothetical protein [Gammaproteobacteria bacterium PRO6]
MNPPAREPWLERSLALLDDSLAAVDAATLSRLNQARQRALAQRTRRRWLGAGALGATAALLLALAVQRHLPAPSPAAPPVAEAVASASTDAATASGLDAAWSDIDEAELADDLAFYSWLATQSEL